MPLICLSATVPNVDEVAAWLRAARGDLDYILHDERAVPLEHRASWRARPTWWSTPAAARKTLHGIGGEQAAATAAAEPGTSVASTSRRPKRRPGRWFASWNCSGPAPAIYFLFSRRACGRGAASPAWRSAHSPEGEALAREARPIAMAAREDRALRQVGLLLRLLRRAAAKSTGLLPVIKMLVEEFLPPVGCGRSSQPTRWRSASTCWPAPSWSAMSKWDGEQHRLLTPNEYRQMTEPDGAGSTPAASRW